MPGFEEGADCWGFVYAGGVWTTLVSKNPVKSLGKMLGSTLKDSARTSGSFTNVHYEGLWEEGYWVPL